MNVTTRLPPAAQGDDEGDGTEPDYGDEEEYLAGMEADGTEGGRAAQLFLNMGGERREVARELGEGEVGRGAYMPHASRISPALLLRSVSLGGCSELWT